VRRLLFSGIWGQICGRDKTVENENLRRKSVMLPFSKEQQKSGAKLGVLERFFAFKVFLGLVCVLYAARKWICI